MKKLIAGNWKLNPQTSTEAINLIKEMQAAVRSDQLVAASTDVLFCVPAPFWGDMRRESEHMHFGSQNIYHEASGAYTGELSLSMLADYGLTYALIGHSERRSIFGEDDTLLQKKIQATLSSPAITPILCVGETLAERDSGSTLSIIKQQLNNALSGASISDADEIVIAYEPVWAIGTGNVCSAEDAQRVCHEIRGILGELMGGMIAEQVRILYGGSVKASNAAELLSQSDINGLLVGGASLDSTEFSKIILQAIN